MNRLLRIAAEATRMMRGHRGRASVMIVGMAVGVASLTMMICVSRGAYSEVMNIVNEQGPDLLQVRPGTDRHTGLPSGSRAVVSLVEDDVHAIRDHIENVMAVAPVRDRRDVDVSYRDKATQTRVFGVVPVWAEIRDFDADVGEFISDDDVAFAARVSVIGQTVKENLFGDADPIGETILVNNVPFTVKGVLQTKGISAEGRNRDDRMVVPFSTYYMRLFRDLHLTQIVITVADVGRMDETVADVASLLRERHGIGPGESDDFAMRTPQDLYNLSYEAHTTMINLFTGIAIVSLLVAGLVITNIMLASVSARRSEIGIRRAFGAKRNDIRNQFLLEGLVVALIGGVVGTVLGYGGSTVLAAFDVAASRIAPAALAASIVTCAFIAVVFGLYPAQRAANQVPMNVLRP